ncbi:septum formation initiator family protein [Streptomyces sp. NPDC101132]|uniref:FtsB family cell division protein n=1 Tax=Streptomyces sp. NPDC101132 TaxID=3366110 RepID=UPI0037F5E647
MTARGGQTGRTGRLGRLKGSPGTGAARTPFVLLVVALLGGGLITLLLLNSALNQGSFQLSKLKRDTTALTDEQQALQRDVDAYSAPDALERRARRLGMVPGGSPVFLGADGKVNGVPSTASAPPPPSPTAAAPAPQAPAASPGGPAGSPTPAVTSAAPGQGAPSAKPSLTPVR